MMYVPYPEAKHILNDWITNFNFAIFKDAVHQQSMRHSYIEMFFTYKMILLEDNSQVRPTDQDFASFTLLPMPQ